MIHEMTRRPLSEATLLRFVARLHKALETWAEAAIGKFLQIQVLNVDEKSRRVNGRNHWIHVCFGGPVTLKSASTRNATAKPSTTSASSPVRRRSARRAQAARAALRSTRLSGDASVATNHETESRGRQGPGALESPDDSGIIVQSDFRVVKVKQMVSACVHTAFFVEAYCRISGYPQTMAALGYGPLAAFAIALHGNAFAGLSSGAR